MGMGGGCALFALLALCGLQSVLERVPALHRGLPIAGCCYLLWLAWTLWRREPTPQTEVGVSTNANGGSALVLGLLTQLGNPQTALVFGSLFAALLPPMRTATDYIMLPGLAFAIDAVWFTWVACLLLTASPRQCWLRVQRPLDRASALVMAGLGARLMVDAP